LGNQNQKTTKKDYIKNSLLNFFLKNQEIIIEFQFENQLFEIIELVENLHKSKNDKKKENVDKDLGEIGNYTKGTLKECIRGIGMMIPDDTEKEYEKKERDSNVFFKDTGKTKSPKNSPGNVKLLFDLKIRFLIYQQSKI
jgi:hypothetical protein